jgi:hypothetical protein
VLSIFFIQVAGSAKYPSFIKFTVMFLLLSPESNNCVVSVVRIAEEENKVI